MSNKQRRYILYAAEGSRPKRYWGSLSMSNWRPAKCWVTSIMWIFKLLRDSVSTNHSTAFLLIILHIIINANESWPQRQPSVCRSFQWRMWGWSPTDTNWIQVHRIRPGVLPLHTQPVPAKVQTILTIRIPSNLFLKQGWKKNYFKQKIGLLVYRFSKILIRF